KLGEFIDIPAYAADKSSELRKHFGNIGGNFGQRARENIEVVVAIHFEIGKIQPGAARSRFLCAWHEPSRFPRPTGTPVGLSGPEPGIFVFLLKFGDLVG